MNKTTDELINKIVAEIGTPLPTYDYEYRKYISIVPKNLSIGNGTLGIEQPDMHDTFRDACIRVVNWHDSFSNGL